MDPLVLHVSFILCGILLQYLAPEADRGGIIASFRMLIGSSHPEFRHTPLLSLATLPVSGSSSRPPPPLNYLPTVPLSDGGSPTLSSGTFLDTHLSWAQYAALVATCFVIAILSGHIMMRVRFPNLVSPLEN